jgi:UDP-2,3-diacylglucosamine pyrophosphatase LpxH
MARDRLVFLSDIHIGIDARTNWYQSRYHEPLLRAAFDWVVASADRIAELILLGDVVDQWTYVPSERPPSFAQIAAANPGIFGEQGAIARALTALDGRVTYVGGNHDMEVGAADVALIRDAQGRSPRFVTDFPYLPAIAEGRVACAHGHQFSMMNAADWQAMPRSGLPLGHAVTRLAALWSLQRLPAGETVADRPGAGEPTGWAFEKDEFATLVSGVVEHKHSIADLVLGALLRASEAPDSTPMTLADGSTQTPAEAMKTYTNLYDRFKNPPHYPASSLTSEAAFFALMEADARNNLGHFARLLGKKHRVVVMGHTHVSGDETQRPHLIHAQNIYANSGFGCPAWPDFTHPHRPHRPTFIEVQVDTAPQRLEVRVWPIELVGGVARVTSEPAHSVAIDA